MTTKKTQAVRCAIYMRVSTDQGLDQEFNLLVCQYEASKASSPLIRDWIREFNSLDAQYEASKAYIEPGSCGLATRSGAAIRRWLSVAIMAAFIAAASGRRAGRQDRRDCRLQGRLPDPDRSPTSQSLLSCSISTTCPSSRSYGAVQHDHLYGSTYAKCPALVCPVEREVTSESNSRQTRLVLQA